MSTLREYHDHTFTGINPDASVDGSDDLILSICKTIADMKLGSEQLLYGYKLDITTCDPLGVLSSNTDIRNIFGFVNDATTSEEGFSSKNCVSYPETDKKYHANENLHKFLRLATHQEYMDANDFYHFAKSFVILYENMYGECEYLKRHPFMAHNVNQLLKKESLPYRVINVANPDDSSGELLHRLIAWSPETKNDCITYTDEVGAIDKLLEIYAIMYPYNIEEATFKPIREQFRELYKRVDPERAPTVSQLCDPDVMNEYIQKLGLNYMIDHDVYGPTGKSYHIVKLA